VTTSTPTVDRVSTAAYRIPTTWQGKPVGEADGTLSWAATTLVVVEAHAGDRTGTGWSYTSSAAAALVGEMLAGEVEGRSPFDVPALLDAMVRRCRNVGRPGLASAAIAAVETALHDLRARLLDTSLATLLGRFHDNVPVYGSGGFTSWDDRMLREQVEGWLDHGMDAVKIKIGLPGAEGRSRDLARVALVRDLTGPDVAVMVDANGAYTTKQAVRMARRLADYDVVWFEEPVSSDDLHELQAVRGQVRCDVAAGEYLSDVPTAARMVEAGAVDCLQADVTRCGGMLEWQRIAAVASARGVEISAHTAPGLHRYVAASVPHLRHLEWFHDHVVIEQSLFDGAPRAVESRVHADATLPGHGMRLRTADAEPYRVA
jgi:L-alanine-DL-glutamate epimerase-like enolase superfamily enzyme